MKKLKVAALVSLSVVTILLFQNFTILNDYPEYTTFETELKRAFLGDAQYVEPSALPPENSTTFEGYDVIVIAGQSNAVGAGKGTWVDPLHTANPSLDERIFQVTRAGTFMLGTDVLRHVGWKPAKDTIGFGMAFARSYVSGLSQNRRVILVPAALGGTSIDEWLGKVPDPDSDTGATMSLVDDMLFRLNAAVTKTGPNGTPLKNRFVAFLWQHGEADIRINAQTQSQMSPAEYVSKLNGIITQVQDAHPTHKFSVLIGEPVPTWKKVVLNNDTELDVVTAKAQYKDALLAYTETSFKRMYVRSGTPEGALMPALTSNHDIDSNYTDTVHYNAQSQINLGRRYYTAFLKTVEGSLAGLRITNSEKFNLSPNIVDFTPRADSEISSNFMNIGQPGFQVKIGLDDRGGGYLNYMEFYGDQTNRISPWFGRGMQTTFRDEYHSRRYNPTQAGFSDEYGAKVAITRTKTPEGVVTGLRIPQFNVPLFCSDDQYDYIETSNSIIKQPPSYEHEADWDLVNGEGNSYNDEIKSEFDFSAKYDRVTNLYGTPAFRHTLYFAYNRNPSAIKQFVEPGAMVNALDPVNAKPVLDVERLIADISPFPGVQTPKPTDLSDMRLVTLSGRFNWDPEVFSNFYYYYKAGVNWTGYRIPLDQNGDLVSATSYARLPPLLELQNFATSYNYQNARPDGTTSIIETNSRRIINDLFIISNVCQPEWIADPAGCPANAPESPISIGYYYPMDDQINQNPLVVMNRSDLSVDRSENRIMQVGFGLGYRGQEQKYAVPRVEVTLSGMLSPQRYVQDRNEQKFEAIRQTIDVVFAKTPVEVDAAVTTYKATRTIP